MQKLVYVNQTVFLEQLWFYYFLYICYPQIVTVQSSITENCTCSRSMNKEYYHNIDDHFIYLFLYYLPVNLRYMICFYFLYLFILYISGSRQIIITQSNNCIHSLGTSFCPFCNKVRRTTWADQCVQRDFFGHYRKGTSKLGTQELIQEVFSLWRDEEKPHLLNVNKFYLGRKGKVLDSCLWKSK